MSIIPPDYYGSPHEYETWADYWCPDCEVRFSEKDFEDPREPCCPHCGCKRVRIEQDDF